jgi:beta-N-acetylhexosaminidase
MKIFYLMLLLFCNISILHSIVPLYLRQTTGWAEKTLQSLTLEQKIGQLFIVAAASNFEQPNEILAASMFASPYTMTEENVLPLIKDYYVGGVVFLYKSDPIRQIALTEKFQKHAGLPLLITQDSEWGLSMRLDIDPTKVVRYPRAMTLGAVQDEKIMYAIGFEIGMQCKAIGVHVNFAPVCDVNNNPENPVIADRSFGDNPEHVALCAARFARGLQDAGILACAKHFPGHGDTTTDSHSALPVIAHSKERLEALELISFRKLINEGIDCVMNAHLHLPAYDNRMNRSSSLSYAVVTQELQKRLGFQGLVITDGLGMKAITDHFKPGELELEAYLAGNDIILCPLDVPAALELIKNTIKTPEDLEDLDNRVLKVLYAKEWVMKTEQQKDLQERMAFLVRPEAYALQKEAFYKALTCAKNDVPMPYGPELLKQSAVITFGLDSENNFMNLLKGKSLLSVAYQAAVQEHEIEECIRSIASIKTVIIGVGKITKYVQQQFGINASVLKMVEQLKEQGKQVIITVFGTPYCLPYFKQADALIVAYEDYSLAHEAAAKFFLGEIEAEGKLPVHITLI